MSDPTESEINEILEWLEGKDDPCLVYYPKEGRVARFASVDELVREYLKGYRMMGICEPLYNVQSDYTRELESWRKDGPPLGRRLSRVRHMARTAVKRGLDYRAALLVMRMMLANDSGAPNAHSRGRKRRLSKTEERSIKNALYKEFREQKGVPPTSAQQGPITGIDPRP